ncbi:MAG: hypothetical protein WEA36_00205 [Balneolaceae bacterium]
MNALQQHFSSIFPPDVRRSWYSRWNGNRLDIHVRSNFARSPEAFREGVIDVGYMLQTLDHTVQSTNQVLEIQSFPSLDQAQWVASVRFHQGGRKHSPSHPDPIRTNDPIEALAELALNWRFSFLFLDRPNHLITGEKPIDKPVSIPIRGILETRGNNPFIWLQVGRWFKEAETMMGQLTPGDPLLKQTRIPESIRQEIPLLAEHDPWNERMPEHGSSGGKFWTPQLLLLFSSQSE